MKKFIKNLPFHPGIFIKEEIEARNWNQRDLAYILDIPEQSITQLVTGKRDINPEMAKKLALAFDVTAELFSNLQQMYDLAIAQDPDENIEKRKNIIENFPIREMVKRKWIKETSNPKELQNQLINFFEVEELNEVPRLNHAAKKTYYEEILPSQLVWLFKLKNLARKIKTPKYTVEGLTLALNSLKELMLNPEDISKIPKILNKVGVRILFVESLPASKIDGACFWLDDDSPVIGLSLRFDRIDNFWFCLVHEIMHVLRGDGKIKEIIDSEIISDNIIDNFQIQKIEQAVNAATADFIISKKIIRSFIYEVRPYYSKEKIVNFSKSLNIHPGIVVGMLQNLKEIEFTQNRPLLVKVRQYLENDKIMDGWGN